MLWRANGVRDPLSREARGEGLPSGCTTQCVPSRSTQASKSSRQNAFQQLPYKDLCVQWGATSSGSNVVQVRDADKEDKEIRSLGIGWVLGNVVLNRKYTLQQPVPRYPILCGRVWVLHCLPRMKNVDTQKSTSFIIQPVLHCILSVFSMNRTLHPFLDFK